MNYERIYYQIIDNAKNCSRKKLKHLDVDYVYYEKHHIIPKCLGGTDDKNNLVLLTAREHFLCHWLLIRIYPSNQPIAYAFYAMCNKKSKRQCYYRPSSRMYQEAKETFSRNGLSSETIQKLKKEKPVGFGDKIRAANLGKKHSVERINASIQGQLRKISELGHGFNKGSNWTEVSKKRFSESRKGFNNPAYGKKISAEHKAKFKKNKKKIIQLSLDNLLIKEWDSSRIIYESLGFSQDQIIATCKGRRISFKNYIWRYATD